LVTGSLSKNAKDRAGIINVGYVPSGPVGCVPQEKNNNKEKRRLKLHDAGDATGDEGRDGGARGRPNEQ